MGEVMRKSLLAFAFTAVFATNTLVGQTTAPNYPWRTQSGVQPVVLPDLQPRSSVASATLPTATAPTPTVAAKVAVPQEGVRVAQNTLATPAPPRMQRRPFLVGFKKQDQELGDAQPSVSDVQEYTFNPPSAPEASDADLQFQGASPEPTLSVQSNATPEEVSNYCDRDCRKPWCNLGCERKLFGQNCRGLDVGGWVSLGYHNRNNILVNNRKSEANLHQAWLYFDNAASQDSMDWDIGYRIDMLYGIDGQDLQAFGNAPTGAPTGWDNSWDNGSYGSALPQAYVQFANAIWDVKVGKFFSPFGYEVIGARDNFFYSHNYTMYLSEPFTMSGVLAERRISDTRSVIIGATAGWDTGFENNSGGNLITGMRVQPNQYVDLALTTSLGDTGARGTGTMSSAVAQMQLTSNLKYVFQADVLNLEDNQEFGIVQYLFRDVSDCVALGARLEWWKSDQLFADTKSTYDFTLGANIRANANITLRPEVRWDWGAAAVDPGATIIGFDAVMTF